MKKEWRISPLILGKKLTHSIKNISPLKSFWAISTLSCSIECIEKNISIFSRLTSPRFLLSKIKRFFSPSALWGANSLHCTYSKAMNWILLWANPFMLMSKIPLSSKANIFIEIFLSIQVYISKMLIQRYGNTKSEAIKC